MLYLLRHDRCEQNQEGDGPVTNARILLMRHAEKTGDPMDPHLSQDGSTRAAKLADYIPATFGIPQFLIATSISEHSIRPIETIEPLSAKIGVPIDATFAEQDYGALASQLLSEPRYGDAGALIVICWHHGNIPSLARTLGAKPGSYPDPWDANVFNQILVLNYSGDREPEVTTLTEPF
jgi:phosphohistidine phosphatase SixA